MVETRKEGNGYVKLPTFIVTMVAVTTASVGAGYALLCDQKADTRNEINTLRETTARQIATAATSQALQYEALREDLQELRALILTKLPRTP